MRYYCYNEPVFQVDANGFHTVVGNEVVTVSEEDIRRDYYPYWRAQMVKKFGEDIFAQQYSFEDCLDDWRVVNWAWESK